MKLEFSRQIFEKKNTQISNFMKIRPLAAELFHAGRQTDIKANSRFSQFCEKPLKIIFMLYHFTNRHLDIRITTQQKQSKCHNPCNRCINVKQEREVIDNS